MYHGNPAGTEDWKRKLRAEGPRGGNPSVLTRHRFVWKSEPKHWSPSQAFVLGYRPSKLGYAVKLSSQIIKPFVTKALKKTIYHTGEKSAILLNPALSSPLKTAELWEQNIYSVLFVLVWIFRQKGKIKDRRTASPWIWGLEFLNNGRYTCCQGSNASNLMSQRRWKLPRKVCKNTQNINIGL